MRNIKHKYAGKTFRKGICKKCGRRDILQRTSAGWLCKICLKAQ